MRQGRRSGRIGDLSCHVMAAVPIAEAAVHWKVSERTLRRRLADGVDSAAKDVDGQWLLDDAWLDANFTRAVAMSAATVEAPLETALIADAHAAQVEAQLAAAEAHAELRHVKADAERAAAKAQQLTNDVEELRRQLDQRQADLAAAATERDVAVARTEEVRKQLDDVKAERETALVDLEASRDDLVELRESHEHELIDLTESHQADIEEAAQSLAEKRAELEAVEAMLGWRARRKRKKSTDR